MNILFIKHFFVGFMVSESVRIPYSLQRNKYNRLYYKYYEI